MHVFEFHSHYLLRFFPIVTALLLSAIPALAGSRSTTMPVSATVLSSCTLAFKQGPVMPRVQSACTRGEQARVSLMTAPSLAAPPPEISVRRGEGGTEFLVVTY